jgi:hypothetical protein
MAFMFEANRTPRAIPHGSEFSMRNHPFSPKNTPRQSLTELQEKKH